MGSDGTNASGSETNRGGMYRRSFLLSLGTVGTAGAVGTARAGRTSESRPADHVDEWPSPDDPYYASLVEDLKGMDLPPGTFVYGRTEADTLAAYEVIGDAATTSSLDMGGDVPFNQATRVEVSDEVTNPWDVTVKGTVEDRPVEAGDVLLGVVYLRSPSGGEARYLAKDEDNVGTNQVEGASKPELDATWDRYYFPIEFDYAAEASTWWTEVFLGYGRQTVDVGGVALIGFDDDVPVDRLPAWQPGYQYDGRAEDAQWRQRAHQRIRQIRKADLEVTVVDAGGNPVEGATVDVTMRDHEFGFGTAVAVNQLPDGNPTYRKKLREDFNKAVIENGLKVPAWSGEWGSELGPESTRAAIQWLNENGIPTRGHALIWEEYDWMNVDPDLPAEEINDRVKSKIRERAVEFEGELVEWDVHNHPIWQSNLRDDLGRDVVPEWWATAREADSTAQTYVNEMNVIAGSAYRDAYDEFVSWLLEEGVELQGIGFMGHFGINALEPPADLLSVFDRFARHDVPLQITEFDVRIDDRTDEDQVRAQRDYVRDVLTAAFSHEAVEGVMSWGFWSEQHWRPAAAYYGSDWTLRPHGEEFRRLVFEEWWTDESGKTDAGGTYATRGFKGEYEISATEGDRSGSVTATLSEGRTSVEVTVTESTPTDADTATPTETGGQAGFGIVSGLAGLAGLLGYALSREDSE